MIKHITATNIKGIDFDYDLAPVNMVVGDNYAGKSAVLEAARLIMAGHIPRLGKQPSSTMKLAGELKDEMSIGSVFFFEGEDHTIIQKWTRKKSGGAGYDIEGFLPNIPPVALDIRDYFDRSAADRVKFVFDKIPAEKLGFDDNQILERLQKLEVLPAALSTIAVKALVEFVKTSATRRDKLKVQRQVWLDKLAGELKVELDDHKSKADLLSSQQRALHKQMPDKTPQSTAPDLAAKEKQVQELQREKTSLEQAFKHWQTTEKRREELDKELAVEPSSPDDLKAEIEKLAQEIARIQSGIKEHEANVHRLRERHRNQSDRLKSLQDEVAGFQSRIQELTTKSACPTCKSKRQGWQDEVKSELEALIINRQGEIKTLTDSLAEIAADGKKSKTELEGLTKSLGQSQMQANTVSTEYNKRQVAAAAYAGARKERETMEQTTPKPDLTNLPVLDESIAALNMEINRLREQETVYTQFLTLKKQKDDAEAQAIHHRIHLEIFKLAQKELVVIQREMVERTIGDLLAKANLLTDGILKAPLEFRDGQIGMTWNNGWIGHETFSGTEEALAFAAFSLALADESPVKIVLIDEMDRLKPERRLALLQRMIDLTKAGVIHQFIGAGVTEEIYSQMPDLNVIRLG